MFNNKRFLWDTFSYHFECHLSAFQVPTQFVESMLEVHSKYTELIKKVFKSDQQFVGALDKVCGNLV